MSKSKVVAAKGSEFAITGHKGFQLEFANGWTISVQWGPGNYTDGREAMAWDAPAKSRRWTSKSAEIAIIDADGNFHRPEGKDWGDDVAGWLSTDDVAEYIAYTASRKDK